MSHELYPPAVHVRADPFKKQTQEPRFPASILKATLHGDLGSFQSPHHIQAEKPA